MCLLDEKCILNVEQRSHIKKNEFVDVEKVCVGPIQVSKISKSVLCVVLYGSALVQKKTNNHFDAESEACCKIATDTSSILSSL